METQFNLDEIEKSFQTYSAGKIVEGVVILKRDDGISMPNLNLLFISFAVEGINCINPLAPAIL